MASTKYTGVSKDKSTGKYMYYFKAGVDLATGKPYQERRRGYDTAKEAFEARTQAMNKVHKKGTLKHTQMNFEQFLEIIFKPNFYASTRQGIEDKNEVIFRELFENLDFTGFVLTCKLAKIGFFYSLATKMLPEKGSII